MSVRKTLAAAIEAGVPDGWVVLPYPTSDPGPVARPTVVIEPNEFTRSTLTTYKHDLNVYVMVADGTPSKAEDALEDALSRLLAVLDPLGWLDISTIARVAFDGRFPAYKITATAHAVAKPTED